MSNQILSQTRKIPPPFHATTIDCVSFKIAPVLVVHGGAWDIPDDFVEPHRQGVANALAAGYALLEKGASAVDAVEAAVAVMEDDEAFDAGRGSFLTSEGQCNWTRC